MRQAEINIAEKAAYNAGSVLLRMQNQVHSISASKKKKNDFVNIAEKASEQEVIFTIQKLCPDDAISSKKSGFIGSTESDNVWIINPLDGATNYLQGVPHYCISVALQVKGEIRHSLIHDPVRDETFYASKGAGAFLNDTRIRMDSTAVLDGGLIATGFPFKNREIFNRYMLQFKSIFKKAGDIRRAGSTALDLAYVAAGRVDGYWEMGLEKSDMAAGSLIVSEAGGDCLDFDLKRDYLDSGNIVAGNLNIIASLQKSISSSMG